MLWTIFNARRLRSSRLVRLRFVLLGSFGEAFDPRPRSNAGGCRRQLANGILYNNVVDAQRIQVIMCRYSSTWTERPSQTPMCVAVLRNLEATVLSAQVAVQQFRACSEMYYEIHCPPLLIA